MLEAKAPKKTMRKVRCDSAARAVPDRAGRGVSPSTTASSISSMEMEPSSPQAQIRIQSSPWAGGRRARAAPAHRTGGPQPPLGPGARGGPDRPAWRRRWPTSRASGTVCPTRRAVIALDLVQGPTDRHGLRSLDDSCRACRAGRARSAFSPSAPAQSSGWPARRPAAKSVTLVHSGEGREVMTRPLGPQKVSSAIGVARHRPALAVHRFVVKQAEQGQIVEVGPAPGFPRNDVVDIGEGHVGAAREATVSIPPHDLSALGIGREPSGPALVHGVPDVVVERHDNGGVTGDPLHGLAVDQAVVLELAGEAGGLA